MRDGSRLVHSTLHWLTMLHANLQNKLHQQYVALMVGSPVSLWVLNEPFCSLNFFKVLIAFSDKGSSFFHFNFCAYMLALH